MVIVIIKYRTNKIQSSSRPKTTEVAGVKLSQDGSVRIQVYSIKVSLLLQAYLPNSLQQKLQSKLISLRELQSTSYDNSR
jgi:hypothetical protein